MYSSATEIGSENSRPLTICHSSQRITLVISGILLFCNSTLLKLKRSTRYSVYLCGFVEADVTSIATSAKKYHIRRLLLIKPKNITSTGSNYLFSWYEKPTVMLTFTYTSDLFIEHLSTAADTAHMPWFHHPRQ